jgi:hypothetical protein
MEVRGKNDSIGRRQKTIVRAAVVAALSDMISGGNEN